MLASVFEELAKPTMTCPVTGAKFKQRDVVAHVFTPSARDFYDIETLYRDAQDVELPFETERPEEDEFEVF